MAKDYLDSGNSEGTSVGQSASSKAGFHNAASVQADAITSVTTTAATTTTPWGFATSTQANAIVTDVNAILVALRNKGIIAT